jgi:hypothetical protein
MSPEALVLSGRGGVPKRLLAYQPEAQIDRFLDQSVNDHGTGTPFFRAKGRLDENHPLNRVLIP